MRNSGHKIYSKQDREKYISKLVSTSPTSVEDQEQEPEIEEKREESRESPKQPKASTLSRSTLVPNETIIQINHPRVNGIYLELRKLNLDGFVNCGAVMFRVFLELSIDVYCKGKKIHGYSEKSELDNKVKAVADHFEQNNIMDNQQLKGVRVAADKSNQHSFLSIHTMHAYVHNPNFSPDNKSLKLTWDNFELFLMKLWE